jgi:hypothetical protein
MPSKGVGSETVKVRVSEPVINEARRLKQLGRYASHYENEFLGYLIELGCQRYEKVILPIELGEDMDRKVHSPAGKAVNGG